jgi:hypothetical protein
MVCSDNLGEETPMIPVKEIKKQKDDLITGITEGLEDFIEGRCKHFKNDEELEAYLMSL